MQAAALKLTNGGKDQRRFAGAKEAAYEHDPWL
jgi:hypothetical protein